MIFSVDGHIEMIRNGLYISIADRDGVPARTIKTHTRRLNRSIYQIGKDYAVQRKRGVKAEPDIRIVMDKIWKEDGTKSSISESGRKYSYATEICISAKDALAEGGYTPEEFEKVFRELNPKWDGWSRWAFEFHVEVSK